jgi:flagellar motility protein MotE (MotC chaperone)
VAKEQTAKNGSLPPELQKARQKAAKDQKKEQKKAARQQAKEAKAAKKGAKAAQGKKTTHAGAVFAGFLYGVFFVLLLIAVGTAFYYFDLGGVRNMVISGLRIDQDSYTIIENRRTELSRIEEQIKTEQQNIQAEKTALVQKEEALQQIEEELAEKQQQIDSQESLLSGKESDLTEIIEMYESMEVESAAEIVSNFSNQDDVIRILRNLSKSKASQILAQLDPEEASEITARMLTTASSLPETEPEKD